MHTSIQSRKHRRSGPFRLSTPTPSAVSSLHTRSRRYMFPAEPTGFIRTKRATTASPSASTTSCWHFLVSCNTKIMREVQESSFSLTSRIHFYAYPILVLREVQDSSISCTSRKSYKTISASIHQECRYSHLTGNNLQNNARYLPVS